MQRCSINVVALDVVTDGKGKAESQEEQFPMETHQEWYANLVAKEGVHSSCSKFFIKSASEPPEVLHQVSVGAQEVHCP